MDPISLILSALVAGAAASVQSTTSDAVKDAYVGLKTLIRRKFAGKTNAEAMLAEHEDDPETYTLPLKKALLQEHVDEDEEIIKEAQRLMTLVQPQQAAIGKFNVQITHAQGVIQGDHAQQTNYFGDQSRMK
jgi:hypothetical protein